MKNPRNRLGKKIATTCLILATLGVLVMLAMFVAHRMRYAVTDAVFVRTDTLVNLAFDGVSGRIMELTKKEGDPVKKGEVLGVIDDSMYKDILRDLKAQLEANKHNLKALKLRLKRIEEELSQGTRIARESINELVKKKDALESKAEAMEVVLQDLARDQRRYRHLLEQGVIPAKKFEVVDTKFRAKKREHRAILKDMTALQASIKKARETLILSRVKEEKSKELVQSIKALEFSIRSIEAKIAIARRNLENCVLRSPLDGRVAKRFVTSGDMALAGKVMYSLVDPRDIYVLVLLEEGKLKGVETGAPVNIHIDAYPKQTFKGVVDAILPASAATFALIPRDISAGEFTKVAQRIPIRVKIAQGDTDLLRIGLGGEVEIERQ